MDDQPIGLSKGRGTGPVPPPPAPEPPLEDAGSHALSEALRSSFVIVKIIMVLLVVVFFGSGIFTVPTQQRAIVLRFGKPLGVGKERLLGPGLHWAWPYPIDEVVPIPFGDVQTVTSSTGWYASAPDGSELYPGGPLNPALQGYVLSGDNNVVHMQAKLRYRITDPAKYKLEFINASNLVQHAVNNALFRAAAEFPVDQLLRQELAFQDRVLTHVRQLVEDEGVGVAIDQAEIKASAPGEVRPAFANAINAANESRGVISKAQGEANQTLSAARGQSNEVINIALSDRSRIVTSIQADAKYFTNQLPSYERNPKLFVDLQQIDALRYAMTNVDDKLFVPQRTDGKVRELRLQLNREPRIPVSPSP